MDLPLQLNIPPVAVAPTYAHQHSAGHTTGLSHPGGTQQLNVVTLISRYKEEKMRCHVIFLAGSTSRQGCGQRMLHIDKDSTASEDRCAILVVTTYIQVTEYLRSYFSPLPFHSSPGLCPDSR